MDCVWDNNLFFGRDFIYLFLERGGGKEKERERNINVWVPLACPLLGTWPATLACALTAIEPATLWFTGPLSYTNQGNNLELNKEVGKFQISYNLH